MKCIMVRSIIVSAFLLAFASILLAYTHVGGGRIAYDGTLHFWGCVDCPAFTECECVLYNDPGQYPTYEQWLAAIRLSPALLYETKEMIYLKAVKNKDNFYENENGNDIISLNKEEMRKKYW